jgi:ABC-type phosphate transport system substrate-binding protein
MWTRRAYLLALALLASAALYRAEAIAAPPFVLIVHPSNPTSSLERRFVTDAFLKKVTRWSHGEAIRPVDQGPDVAVRRRFSEDVLKRSVAAVRSYWQQIIFSGRGVPPPELGSDEDVVRFVLKDPGAVGYVAGTANTNGAKIVSIE